MGKGRDMNPKSAVCQEAAQISLDGCAENGASVRICGCVSCQFETRPQVCACKTECHLAPFASPVGQRLLRKDERDRTDNAIAVRAHFWPNNV